MSNQANLPMSLPNIITIARILAVPLIVWLIITNQMMLAFVIFVAAGISDGVGWIYCQAL